MTLLYKNSSYSGRTQEDAIASDLVTLTGDHIRLLLSIHIKNRKSGSKKPGHDDQNVKNKLYVHPPLALDREVDKSDDHYYIPVLVHSALSAAQLDSGIKVQLL